MVARTARWTLLLGLGIFLGLTAWLYSNPHVLSSQVARLATRHLLRDSDGNIRIQHIEGNLFSDVELHGVVLSLRGERGAAVIVGVDTLKLSYDAKDLLRSPLRLRRVELRGAEIRGQRGAPRPADEIPEPGSPFDLPRFRIETLQLSRSMITVSGPSGRIEQSLPEVSWRGLVKADSTLVIVSEEGAFDWASRDSRLDDLHGLIVVDQAGLRAQQFSLRLNGKPGSLSAYRSHAGELDLAVIAEDITTSEIESLIDMSLGFVARGDADLHLVTRSDTLDLDIGFTGELEGYTMNGIRGRSRLTPGWLRWSQLEGRINGAWFSGRGEFDVRDEEDVRFTLDGAVADVDLARGLVPDVVLPATDGWGRLHIWRRDLTNETLVTGWLADGRIAAVPFDSVYVNLSGSDDGLVFHGLDLYQSAQSAHLTGRADSSGTFTGHLDIETADLATLPASWPLPPLHGSGRLSGVLTGLDPVYDYRGTGRLRTAGLDVLEVGDAELDFMIEDVLGSPGVELSAHGTGLRAYGVPLGAFEVAGVATAEAARLHEFRSVHGDTVVTLRGQAEFGADAVAIYVPDLDFTLEGSEWRLSDPLRLRTAAGHVSFARTGLRSDVGSLHGELLWDRASGRLEGGAELDRFDTRHLDAFLPGDPGMNGELTAALHLGGSPDEPIFGLEARLDGCTLPLATIDSLTTRLVYHDGTVDILALDLHAADGTLGLTGSIVHPGVPLREFWPGAGLALNAELVDADWAFIDQFRIPALDRVAGRFDASVAITGDTRRPVLKGGVESRPFHVHWLHLDELTGSVAYADDQLTLAALRGRKETLELAGRIELPLELDFLSEPISPLDGPLYMSFRIPDGSDLAPLVRTCNAFVESSGRGGLDLVISGPARHPFYSGHVRVESGGCVIKGQNEVYHDVNAEGIWSGDELVLHHITGREGARGTLQGDGRLLFNGLVLEGFELDVAADRFLVASIPELRALVRSESLRLSGVKVGPDSLIVPRFDGAVEVIDARYLGDFAEQAGGIDPSLPTVAPDWLADLEIEAPPRTIHVINRTMELHLGGDVRLVRDAGGMKISGALSIDQGRLPVFNNDFKVTRGDVFFTRDLGVIPRLDIAAETSVRLPADGGSRRLEKINIGITGIATEPQVVFSSESGYARSNIERMLLGMSPHTTGVQSDSAIRQGTIAAGFNLLEREVAQELDLIDTFDIESGRIREDGTTQTLIGVGKYIGRDLYVKFAQAVTDQDREVVVEYQMTDHLLLQSEISRRLNEALGNTTYSVDLKYRFEY